MENETEKPMRYSMIQHDQNTFIEYHKIRPHRFGGEGVLIGVQTTTLNA